jgi:hypothetical protein
MSDGTGRCGSSAQKPTSQDGLHVPAAVDDQANDDPAAHDPIDHPVGFERGLVVFLDAQCQKFLWASGGRARGRRSSPTRGGFSPSPQPTRPVCSPVTAPKLQRGTAKLRRGRWPPRCGTGSLRGGDQAKAESSGGDAFEGGRRWMTIPSSTIEATVAPIVCVRQGAVQTPIADTTARECKAPSREEHDFQLVRGGGSALLSADHGGSQRTTGAGLSGANRCATRCQCDGRCGGVPLGNVRRAITANLRRRARD